MLKVIILLAALAFGAFWWLNHKKEVEKTAAKVDNQATRYAETLKKDVEKAEDVQKKAAEAIKKTEKAVGDAVQ